MSDILKIRPFEFLTDKLSNLLAKKDYFFFIPYIILLFDSYADIDNKWLLIPQVVALLFMLAKIYILDNHDLKTLIIYSLLIFIGLLSMIYGMYGTLFKLSMMIIAAYDVDFKNICKVTAIVSLAFLLIEFGLYFFFNVGEDVIKEGNIMGHSFGFTHPNRLAFFSMLPVFSYSLCMNRDKLWVKSGVMLVISVVVYYITTARSVLIVSIIYFVYLMFSKNIDNLLAKIKHLDIIGCILIFVIIFGYLYFDLCIYKFNPTKYTWLERILSGRLGWGVKAFYSFPLSLFGQKNTPDCWIDTLYIYLPVFYGLIPSLLMFGLNLFIIKKTIFFKRYDLFILIILSILFGQTENYLGGPKNLLFFIALAKIYPINSKINQALDAVKS